MQHSMEDTPDADAPHLTPDLLAKVLALADQKDRMTAALVSTAWQTAAVATSREVLLSAGTPDKLDSMRLYLRHHGAQVVKLSLGASEASAVSRISLTSPLEGCSKLRDLELESCNVDMGSFLEGVAGLTRLRMVRSTLPAPPPSMFGSLPAPPADLAPLSSLKALQHLHCALPKEQNALFGVRFPAGVLCQLTHLTYITLQKYELDEPALRGISLLTNLQQLELGPARRESVPDSPLGDCGLTAEAAASVSGLQQLTSLGLAGVVINSTTAPGLSTLTALKELSLCDCSNSDSEWDWHTDFRPAGLLEAMTGLTHLFCRDASVDISQLLMILPGLQQLQFLGMHGVFYDSAPAADFGALTASSKLREVELLGVMLPAGALATMFSPRKQLTAVTRLAFKGFNYDQEQTLGTPELQAIVRCCPALRSLVARDSVCPGTDWGVLAQLKDLTQLEASHVTDAEAAGLAHLVQLHSLSLVPPDSSISILGVQHLTALKRLTLFKVFSDYSSTTWSYVDQAPHGSPPDVWKQIQRDTCGGGLSVG